jgi:hypothetical protein
MRTQWLHQSRSWSTVWEISTYSPVQCIYIYCGVLPKKSEYLKQSKTSVASQRPTTKLPQQWTIWNNQLLGNGSITHIRSNKQCGIVNCYVTTNRWTIQDGVQYSVRLEVIKGRIQFSWSTTPEQLRRSSSPALVQKRDTPADKTFQNRQFRG